MNAPSNTAAAANSVAPRLKKLKNCGKRETAQNILAELLDLQESLEEKEVASWAETEINIAFFCLGQSGAMKLIRARILSAQLLSISRVLKY